MRIFQFAIFFVIFIFCDALADYKDDIGYTALKQKTGSEIPDGSSIPLVTQSEAAVLLDHDRNDQTDKIRVWMPDPGRSEFSSKRIIDMSGSPRFYSRHATSVGARFYGKNNSIATGIKAIESFIAGHWMRKGFLKGGDIFKPLITASRVANHSWIGKDNLNSSEVLRRLDWVVHIDEYVQAVGPCRPSNPLLGSAFNVIAVGRSKGENGTGSIGLDTVYTSGRTCPQLIAPLKNASAASPVVASAAALLIDLARRNPALSAEPTIQQMGNRFGDTIYNAERSEVIKAALLAGADRITHNTVIIDGSTPNISNYRVKPEDRTASGLDRRYGAGQLNIYNSYHVISGGEQNSQEDAPLSKGIIGCYGFDYDPFFGGRKGSNSIASYHFPANDGIKYLWASLAWNIKINGGTGSIFNGEAILFNLDLFLYDITELNTPYLVASSTSSGENTENLWVRLAKQRNYLIQIKPGAGQTAFIWDYALAWRIGNPSERSKPL